MNAVTAIRTTTKTANDRLFIVRLLVGLFFPFSDAGLQTMLFTDATRPALFGAVPAIFAVLAGVARIGARTRSGESVRKSTRG